MVGSESDDPLKSLPTLDFYALFGVRIPLTLRTERDFKGHPGEALEAFFSLQHERSS